jgi:alpha-amylase
MSMQVTMPSWSDSMSRTLMRILATGFVVALVACGGGGGGGGTAPVVSGPPQRPALPELYRPTGHGAAGDVFVHLFEWKWTDIASECENVLGPAGLEAVQVSPPQEHITGAQWWIRYQPVRYSIDRSRSGTRAEFVDMVTRCKAAGVDIYVDAVVNHMTAGQGTGSNGSPYTKYDYPGLYAVGDFHQPCAITDYQSAANVQDCELVGLADLNTSLPAVQRDIADYLVMLAGLGVAGFRIDATKHMQPVELDAILDSVNARLAAQGKPLPYHFAEVIDHGGEAVTARDYFGLGYGTGGAVDITEFKFRGVGDKFLGGGQRISQLDPNGPAGSQFSPAAWGLMPADKAVVFLENHDTQRGGGISYRDGAVYRLANVWMLAQPYGYPSVMSSYAFDRNSQAGDDAGPPSNAANETNPVSCASSLETATIGQWVCEHRDPSIARMVGFRRFVAGTDVNRWWSNGQQAIAFSRGDKGFVAINRENTSLAASISSGLPAGSYCDLLTGGRSGGACAGTTVTIDAAGAVQVSLPALTAIAVHTGARL